jgi:hypothetical protein
VKGRRNQRWERNLPLYIFIHHEFHAKMPGIELKPPWWKDSV